MYQSRGYSYRQSGSGSGTNSSYALTHSDGMAFEWETTFESGMTSAGLHLFASEASSTHHGDSYLVWQNSTDLMIYKSSSNNLVLQTSTPLSNVNGQTHRYKVTYNPTNGQMAVWRDGVAVLNWTDSTAPLTSGSYITLRTNKSVVKFDNLRIIGNPATYSQLFYLYSDHLGSTSVIANSAGQLVDKATYLPFGGYRRGDSSILTESGFTGHLHNDSLGLIYMNARFYSPATARFISADTIIPDPTNPQSYNRYSYVYNNPLGYIDPDGHDPYWCEGNTACIQSYIDSYNPPSVMELAAEQGLTSVGSFHWQNPPNDFQKYYYSNPANDETWHGPVHTANCWEFVMFTYINIGEMPEGWVVDFYDSSNQAGMDAFMTTGSTETAVYAANQSIWEQLGAFSATLYNADSAPQEGQLIFFTSAGSPYPGHVALAVGGNMVVSLWNLPNKIYDVQYLTIEELAAAMEQAFGFPVTVTVGDPPWLEDNE